MWVPVERREAWVRRSHSPVWRGFAALLAGALPAFAFPESNIAWFAYIALVPWMMMLRTAPTGRRAFLDGWIGGLGFMLAVHQWLIPSLHVFILVLGGFLGLLWGPWGWLVRFMLRGRPSVRRTVAALAVLPSGWLIIETVRSLDGLGGPWGLLGASQWDVAPALRLASVGGVWLVSLLVVAVNTALTVLLTVPPVRTTAVAGLTACVVAVGVAWVWAPLPENAGHARVAIVQPGVIGGIERRFVRSEELTRSLAGQDLDLVVWGESSVGRDLTTRPDLANRVVELSRQVGSPVLVNMDAPGSDEAGRTGIFKSAVLVGPDGLTGDRYDKMRLVPFGEYIPMRDALGWATSVGKAASQDRRRGTHQAVMVLPGPWQERLRIGPLICFESAFPDMSRSWSGTARSCSSRSRRPRPSSRAGRPSSTRHWPRCERPRRAARRCTPHSPVSARCTARRASRSVPRSAPIAARAPSTRCRWRAAPPRSSTSAPGRCTARWPSSRPSARSRGPGRSDGLRASGQHHTLTQLVRRKSVPGAERLPRAYGVEERQHALLDAALPGDRHPVAAPADAGLALVVDDLGDVVDGPLGVLSGDFEDLLGGAVHPVHHADGGETVAGELEHDMVCQALADPGADVDVLDGAGEQEAQGVHDMDEVVQDEEAGVLGQADAVLLHEDQIARMLQALRVGGREAPVEAHGETRPALLGEGDQALRVAEFVREGLVDEGRHTGLQQPGGDLGVRGGRRVDERGVQSLGEQRGEVGVAPLAGDVVTVADPREGGRGAGLQMKLDPGQRGEHRQIRLLGDVAEPYAADLHVGLPVALPRPVSHAPGRGGPPGRP